MVITPHTREKTLLNGFNTLQRTEYKDRTLCQIKGFLALRTKRNIVSLEQKVRLGRSRKGRLPLGVLLRTDYNGTEMSTAGT